MIRNDWNWCPVVSCYSDRLWGEKKGQSSSEEPASSVCVLAGGAGVWTESAGAPLGSDSEEQLTISTVIWDPLSLDTRPVVMGKSGEESLARSCSWSWSEPASMLTVLHNLQRLWRVSSRFCSSSVLSCSNLSFSPFYRVRMTGRLMNNLHTGRLKWSTPVHT